MFWLDIALYTIVTVAIGLYLFYALNLAAGGLIVLVTTAVFLLCWVFAPRHGLIARFRPGAARGGTGEGASADRQRGVVNAE